jgi:hypothetical protein
MMDSNLNILYAVLKGVLTGGAHEVYAAQYIDACEECEKLVEVAPKQIAVAKSCYKAEQEAYSLSRKNHLSKKITEATKLRKKQIAGLYGLGIAAEQDDDALIKESGTIIIEAVEGFKKGGVNTKTDDTGRINKMLAKLESDYADDIVNVHGEKVISKLKTLNKQIYDWEKKRSSEVNENKGLLSKRRKLTDDALEDLRTVITGHAIVEGIDAYKTLVNKLNSINASSLKDNANHKRMKAHKDDDLQKENTEKENKQKNKKQNTANDAPKDNNTSKENNEDGKTVLTPEKEAAPKDNNDKNEQPSGQENAPSATGKSNEPAPTDNTGNNEEIPKEGSGGTGEKMKPAQ